MRQEPWWWEKAQKLRAKGLSYPSIGRIVGKNHFSVRYATNPEVRASHRHSHFGKRFRRRDDDAKARKRIVEAAREEAAATGGHIDLILLAWGAPPRRIASIDDARRIQRA